MRSYDQAAHGGRREARRRFSRFSSSTRRMRRTAAVQSKYSATAMIAGQRIVTPYAVVGTSPPTVRFVRSDEPASFCRELGISATVATRPAPPLPSCCDSVASEIQTPRPKKGPARRWSKGRRS